MARISINTRQQYVINGQKVNASEEWQDVRIVANYENDAVQPELSIDDFRFNGKAKAVIEEWIKAGRIFEGCPIKITLFNNTPQAENFVSILNFVETYKEFLDDGVLSVGVRKEGGIDQFFDQISTISFGYLENTGFINSGDYVNLDYVVEKRFDPLEFVIISIVIYLLAKETIEATRRAGEQVNVFIGIITGGGVANSSIGAALYAAGIALVEVAYAALLVVQIINLGNQLFKTLIPPRRRHKAFPFGNMLRKVCQYYGYTFSTNITLFDSLVYLPSNPNFDEPDSLGFIRRPRGVEKGIPRDTDRGYICSEIFELAKQLCDGKYAIFGKEVVLRSKDDPYWLKRSTWQRPDVLLETKEFNTGELFSTILLTFETDLTDEYTIENFGGTSVEIRTDVPSVFNQRNVLLKGLREERFGVALGSRKNSLTVFEKALRELGGTIDAITRPLGGFTNFRGKVKSRVGALKVSTNNHNLPKLIYVQGGKLPPNHRQKFNARLLWDNYFGDSSFVRDGYKGQKAIYRNVEIPFGLEDYKQLTDNAYFFDRDGREAKIINLDWNMDRDKARIDYWVREVYTRNLNEIIYEP